MLLFKKTQGLSSTISKKWLILNVRWRTANFARAPKTFDIFDIHRCDRIKKYKKNHGAISFYNLSEDLTYKSSERRKVA